jgi:hypothetical protein
MEQKRLDIDQLRLQRERMRRIAVGVLLVTVVLILASCQGLTPRDAAAAAVIDAVFSTVGSSNERQTIFARGGNRLSYAARAHRPTDRRRERS